LIPKPDSTVVVSHGEDPLLVVGQAGAGRSVAFAPDFAPHWAPPEFVQWPHYPQLWTSIIRWASGGSADGAAPQRSVTGARL